MPLPDAFLDTDMGVVLTAATVVSTVVVTTVVVPIVVPVRRLIAR